MNSMTSTRYRALARALLIATALGAGAAVYAQTGAPVWDASQLPETKGTVKQYILTMAPRSGCRPSHRANRLFGAAWRCGFHPRTEGARAAARRCGVGDQY